jgi:hypothetical protein
MLCFWYVDSESSAICAKYDGLGAVLGLATARVGTTDECAGCGVGEVEVAVSGFEDVEGAMEVVV